LCVSRAQQQQARQRQLQLSSYSTSGLPPAFQKLAWWPCLVNYQGMQMDVKKWVEIDENT